MKVRVADMERHVLSLCDKWGINIEWCRRPLDAWAVRECELIHIAPIKSSVSYAVALHEIGHIKGLYQRSPRSMAREHWAWEWAQRNALVWTPRMDQKRRSSLALCRPRARLAP